MRCSEEFLAQLAALHEAAIAEEGRISRTDILHDLVQDAARHLFSDKPTIRSSTEELRRSGLG